MEACVIIVCTSSPVPFISATVQSKLAIRAVLLNDGESLKSLMEDADRLHSVGDNAVEFLR